MPKLTADEIVTQKHKRAFIQWGGPKPGNPVAYAGQDAQYMAIDGVTVPESGGVDPIWVPDPNRQGRYRLVGRTISPPDLASATLMIRERHGLIPRQLLNQPCSFNFYEVTGPCRDLSDFIRGWSDYILIYSLAIVTEKDLGTRTAWDSDDAIEDSLSITLADVYPVGSITFSQEASTDVDLEVVDIVYGGGVNCGNCGAENDGTRWIYAVTKSSGGGSPGLPGEVVYSVDGGVSWNQIEVDGMSDTEDPVAIEVVGNYLVVVGLDAYYYAELDLDTGAPGTFTAVTTGFVAAGSPTDVYVLSSREVWFCGDGGYIYKSTDITAGVSVWLDGSDYTEDLKRISGSDETIVAVGALGQVLYTINRGASWTAAVSTPANTTLQALAVRSDKHWWVGGTDGRVYYTLTGGKTWTEKGFSGAGVGQVYEIVFATEEVGYISRSDATPTAVILATYNGGEDWSSSAPRIASLPVFDRANRIAIPKTDAGIAANNIAIAGLAGDGSDGLILLGIAAKF